jgi:rsbT co-antagonist protein RsbR
VIDSQRANSLIDRLLTEVSRSGALFAILDLTGVEALDTSTAGHLLKLIASIRLLGAEGVITGISSHVAQTIVGIGVDLKSVKTCANLRDGLRYCIAKMGA